MATLDVRQKVFDYNFKLKCHSSREPDEALIRKLGESLQLARKMVNVADFQLADVIQNLERKKHKWVLKPQYGGYPVAVEAAKYHLKLTEWDKGAPKYVREVMHKTAIGLNKCITMSDVLGLYTTDLYKVYRDRDPLRIDQARHLQPGKFRKITAEVVEDRDLKIHEMEGYVYPKNIQKGIYGSIHIEFSLATIYPRAQMARVIVHEATHKFAGTYDAAYCNQSQFYPHLSAWERTHNADSYAFVVLSINYNQVIRDQEECFRVIPQYGPLEWEHAADKLLYGRGRSKSF